MQQLLSDLFDGLGMRRSDDLIVTSAGFPGAVIKYLIEIELPLGQLRISVLSLLNRDGVRASRLGRCRALRASRGDHIQDCAALAQVFAEVIAGDLTRCLAAEAKDHDSGAAVLVLNVFRGLLNGLHELRSGLVLEDQKGELIGPVVRAGRPGMPKFTFTDDQIADIANFVHTFRAAGYDESRLTPPSIVVGDAKAGQMFFSAKCASCHSPSGDLRGLATRIEDPRLLQQTWLMPGSGASRGGSPPVRVKPTTVTVTLRSGEKVEGTLDHIDDFMVALTTADGTHRSFRTAGDTPKVEVHDPLQPHRELLRTYTDNDIHNVTAYLVTLK